jgi:hypothetical protein
MDTLAPGLQAFRITFQTFVQSQENFRRGKDYRLKSCPVLYGSISKTLSDIQSSLTHAKEVQQLADPLIFLYGEIGLA